MVLRGRNHAFMYILGVQQAQASLSFIDKAVQIDIFNHTRLWCFVKMIVLLTR